MPIGTIKVPHCGPENSRILLVGEAPGLNEEHDKSPFVGQSGDLLITCLGRSGVRREEVRLANLCNYRPLPDNKFERVLGSQQLNEGLAELFEYIDKFKPTVIGALGKFPLEYLTGLKGITRFRGSILPYQYDPTIKVVPTYHPAYVLRDRSTYPIFDLDLRRIIEESQFPEFNYPEYEFHIDPKGVEAELLTQQLCNAEYLGTDIETVKNSKHILCIGFADSAKRAVVFPWNNTNQDFIRRILASRAKKIFQFGTFDTTQLMENGMVVENYAHDTLTAQHAMNPELPRGLDFLVSVYTRQPYYKHAGRSELPNDAKAWSTKAEKHLVYEYNGKDCCCTYAVAMEQIKELADDPLAKGVFDFEMEEIEMARQIGMTGLPIDIERRNLIKKELLIKWATQQSLLDFLAKEAVNVRSPKLKEILFKKLGLPEKKKRDGTLTTDEDAIIELITYCGGHIEKLKRPDSILEWKVKRTICKLILEIRGIRQLLSMYFSKDPDENYRLHSTYKVSGPETGRWACEKYVDGTGINAQTMPREPIELPETVSENVQLPTIDEDDDEADGSGFDFD